MISFMDLNGIEGIDKLNECVPYVDELLSDKEMFDGLNDKTWAQSAGPIYKKHSAELDTIFEILGEKPESAVEILAATSQLMVEIFQNKELCGFFMGACAKARSMILAMANTKAEQSKAS